MSGREEFEEQLKAHSYVRGHGLTADDIRYLRHLDDSVYFFDIRVTHGVGLGWELTLRLNPFRFDVSLNVASKYSGEYGNNMKGVRKAEADLVDFARKEYLPALIEKLQLPELAGKV